MAWGEIRVAVFSAKPEILNLLSEGWSLTEIHKRLFVERGQNVNYKSFYYYVQKFRREGAKTLPARAPLLTPKPSDQRDQKSTAAARTASPPLARGQLMVRMPHDDDPEATAHALIYGDDSNGDDL